MRSFKLFHVRRWASRAALKLRGLSSNQGQALVELTLLMPVFLLMLVGAAEFARLEYAQIEVANAARAGAEYGAQNLGTAANVSTMQSVAIADALDLSTLHATASTYCKCSNGTNITCANAGTTCTARVIQYVQVQTTATVNPSFHLPGFPSTYTMHGWATMRVEQ